MSHYKLTSTVILHLANKTEALGDMDLSGNMTRQVEVDLPVESDGSHVANVGRLVEDMELKMRNLLRMFPWLCWFRVYANRDSFTEEVYFGKAKDVVGELRSKLSHNFTIEQHANSKSGLGPLSDANRDRATQREMIASMQK